MKISSESLPTEQIRNNQCGDWSYSDTEIAVKSLAMSDWRYELLIQLHELVEATLCKHRGITDQKVTEFDEQFEKERSEGLHSETDEDGDDPRAPYRKEHFFATNIERLMAAELDVDWKDYEKEIYATTEA